MATIDPAKVRNVGILGHGGVGKTMLVERILNDAGATSRYGSIEDGNTVADYLEDEIERKHSIAMKLLHVEWEGYRIHMVDHPGYVDFLGEIAASTPLLDGAVILVDASVGVQVGTDNAWKYTERFQVPRAFFVNKLDRDLTDFQAIVKVLQDVYGKQCVPLVAPVGASASLSAAVNVVSGDTSALGDEADLLRMALVELVAETDDTLTEKYLETGELSEEEFVQGLRAGIKQGKIVPIIAGSVSKDIGVRELMKIITETFPNPLDRQVIGTLNGAEVKVKVGPDEPFLAQIFRSVVDPFVGHLSLFRVLSGTLHSDTEFYNVTSNTKERTGKLYMLNGKDQKTVAEVGPGDLAAMTKLKNTHFGDTIGAPGTLIELPKVQLPASMVKLAIVPKARADEDKIGEALNRLAEEDPTFTHYRDPDTKDHIIRGTGDLQLEILLNRLKRKFRVEADTQTPKVAYRETIKGQAEVQGKHKKQTGGHGQYGDAHLRVMPNERGGGYEFIDSIVGGVVPKNFIPAVDKGAQEALLRGVISGNPVVDIKVELFFGSFHAVDSSEMAFKIAASMAIQKGVREAKPVLLEPVMEIAVTVPEEYMGDISGNLNSRRGRILGMESMGGGRQCIRAIVPEAEILRYSTDLRSMTAGRGSYELKFSHYDEVPEHVARELIAAYEKSRTEEQD
jgi:elongation factor G